ncbi:hypothetical protein KY345_05240, partial [Candidatus Woesearchaeota archaeon]|nr:hypothetical protein [Candidatus Woesearchaeota archaeon]
TNGDPVKASRECYKDIDKQLKNIRVKIIGLGVTGSGRKIAGLHAMTDGIINEIIAHATAATFFDKEVDTIIEIGGQDAKYTYLVNGVPCDYAMNEACSAGTGSFLEEASKESLNITYLDIQDIALKADNPPNFNDQCAAFISSDVKNASHENISRENIVAGLVYSICMNYNNRVKGARRLGDKIFMQGGVCYNKAVPLAMASILKKQIIVPPDPGLMGAFGVALEIKNRIKTKLADKSEFSLKELVEREVEYDKSFTCPGTQENCDRGCTINMIKIGDKKYPFGGICNKYYNLMHHISIDSTPLNLVAKREKLLFEKKETAIKGKIMGIPKTFYVNMLYPLYYNFFDRLGLNVVLGDKVDLEGVKKVSTSFCFPAEIAHGMFMDLLKKNPSYIFLPQVTELFIENTKTGAREHQCTCLLAQSEPFFIRSSFRDIDTKIFSPVIDFRKGWNTMENEFVKLGAELGKGKNETKKAFRYGVKKLEEFDRRKKEFGDKMLEELKKDKTKIAIVIFGRGYNAFVDEANLGIPSKLASRGVYVIPFDCLRYESEEHIEKMNWALGHDILKASKLVKEHPQLFGAYITNFSCGPDSFLVGYFRDIMATKPSLTLELDSHSADAGINTRIEAFLDIVNRFRQLSVKDEENDTFRAAEIKKINGKYKYLTSDRKQHSLKDIKMLIPSMGRTISEFSAATMRGAGYKSGAVELPEFETLMLGRKNTSCKECLPLILTTASLLDYIQKNPDEKLIYFMPTCPGNCRFSQYNVFINKLIKKKQLKNIALLSLTSENSYIGLGIGTQLNVLRALIVADIMDDIRNAMLVLPEDKEAALKIYDEQKDKLNKCFENGSKDIYEVLEEVASELSKIKLKTPLSKAKKALVAGEIYVRKDEFSSQEVIKRLAKKGIVSMRSPMLEWIYYVDYLTKTMYAQSTNLKEKTGLFFKEIIEKRFEKKIKKILAKSGLYEYEIIDVEKTMATGSNFVNPAFTSEVILVIGAFFNEVAHKVHGVISIGPFGCMPTRVTESILNHECIIKGNKRLGFLSDDVKKFHTLPFLSIECDGNPFPQIVESRIEAFSLQVERVYDHLNR